MPDRSDYMVHLENTVADLQVKLKSAEAVVKAVERFLKDANRTAPWESAGVIWGDMCLRLNEALLNYKAVVSAHDKGKVAPEDGRKG